MIAVAFALRGTLTAAPGLEREAFLELLRERESDAAPPVREAATSAADVLFGHAGEELPSPARLAAAAIGVLGRGLAEEPLIARFRLLAARSVSRYVTAAPGTREALQNIESLGMPSAVLCNGWSRIAQAEAAWAGFNGAVIVSEDIGFAKPAPQAFAALVERTGLPAGRIWYVGNDPHRDIDGAARAGLTAVWLNESGAAYPHGLEPPALTIARFEDVLPPLCAEYTRSLLSLRHLMRSGLEWRQGHFVPGADQAEPSPEGT